jgi:hypothetical protein
VNKYGSFEENAYRLVFPYEDQFPDKKPDLVTILPNGTVENSKKLEPEKERGLIAYTYGQKIEAKDVEGKNVQDPDSQWNGKPCTDTPFVKAFPGAKQYGLVQTWPTKFNEKFKQDFKLSDTNPDSKAFEASAVNDYKACMEALFGPDCCKKVPIQYATKTTVIDNPIYHGMTEDLRKLFLGSPAAMAECSIKEMTPTGFMSQGEDGKGTKLEKPFTMEANTEYVVYKKKGWESMGCCKTKVQFDKECKFLGQGELIKIQ